jgi:anti-anti-sigma factor
MIAARLNLLFGCRHRRLTRPITPVHRPGTPSGETYVACLECGKRFPYDATNLCTSWEDCSSVLDNYRCLEVRILTDLTARNAASIRTGILSAWEERGKPGPLILDLAGARHIDSSGVSALLAVSQRTEDAGVLLVLRGLRASPRRMLERTGLGVLFHIADTHAPADAA